MKTDYELSELDMDAVIPEGEKAGTPVKDEFCKDWDGAKVVMLSLQALFASRPLINLLIGFIIEIGDKIQVKICAENK